MSSAAPRSTPMHGVVGPPRPLSSGLLARRARATARRHHATAIALFGWGRSSGSSGSKKEGSSPSGDGIAGSAYSVADATTAEPVVEAPAGPQQREEQEQAEWPEGPIVSCGGGGIYFFWMLGVMKFLSARYDLKQATLIGASAGGLIAALTACEVDLDAAVQRAYQLAQENKLWDRPLGLVGAWGPIVRQWLYELLPDDAHITCSGGRVRLIATELPSLRQVYLQDFATKDELVDACMASAHVPLVLDGRPFTSHKGRLYLDGSLQDFIVWDNSPLLTCGGRAFLLDYSRDDRLAAERFDFLKIRVIDEVLAMIRCGYRYARRLDRAGGLDAYLGPLRVAPPPSSSSSSDEGAATASSADSLAA